MMSKLGSGVDSKTLPSGSEPPAPPSEDKIQIYSMRYCPYAERILIALELKQLPYQVVNCNLRKKPDWFVAKNPLGKVPVLIHNDNVIYESILCAEYVENVFESHGERLLPADTIGVIKQKMAIELISSKLNQVYGLYSNFKNKDILHEKLTAYEKALHDIEERLNDGYLTGSTPSFTDYMLWPWFERLPMVFMLIAKNVDSDKALKWEAFPRICAYRERMLKIDAIATVTRSTESHLAFVDSLSTADPNYDI